MLRFLLVALVVLAAWFFYEPSIEHGPGVLAPDDPIQVTPADPTPFEFRDYSFEPLADFSLIARVLGRQTYRTGRESDLSPLDLALGWGRMSDSTVLEPFRFSQSSRWYRYKTSEWTISKTEVTRHSANMHMIPSTPEIDAKLDDIIVGQVISLSGSLVRIEAKDGWKWKSSLTRSDDGAGSCEIIWVTDIQLR